MGVVKLLNW